MVSIGTLRKGSVPSRFLRCVAWHRGRSRIRADRHALEQTLVESVREWYNASVAAKLTLWYLLGWRAQFVPDMLIWTAEAGEQGLDKRPGIRFLRARLPILVLLLSFKVNAGCFPESIV